MKNSEFAYWLQGFFEISDPQKITKKQREIILNHINLCLTYEKMKPSSNKKITAFIEDLKKELLSMSLVGKEETKKIKTKWSTIFEHIDFDNNQGLSKEDIVKLIKEHAPNTNPVLRC